MKNVSHNKLCISREVHIHVEPSLIPLIKMKLDIKSDKYYAEFKLHRNSISEKFDMYDFIMTLFVNGDLEGFLLFQQHYKMTLDTLEI